MKNKTKRDVENVETWDFSNPEVRKPNKMTRVVVSVSFHRDDFDVVSQHAELAGKRTSEFIRNATLEKTRQSDSVLYLFGTGGAATVWSTDPVPNITVASGILKDTPQDELSFTLG